MQASVPLATAQCTSLLAMPACAALYAPPAGALLAAPSGSCSGRSPHAHGPASFLARPPAARPLLQPLLLQGKRLRQQRTTVLAAAAGKDDDRPALQRRSSRLKAPEGGNSIVPGPQLSSPGSDSVPEAKGSEPRAAALSAGAAAGAVTKASSSDCSSGGAATPSADPLAGLHRPVGVVLGSAWVLAVSVQLAGVC